MICAGINETHFGGGDGGWALEWRSAPWARQYRNDSTRHHGIDLPGKPLDSLSAASISSASQSAHSVNLHILLSN